MRRTAGVSHTAHARDGTRRTPRRNAALEVISDASDAASPRRVKRKPQARSAVTRESILDAALDCLVERGYARTAMADVAERAGVSRGALLHHFPTRFGLLGATVEHLAVRRLAELRRTLQGAEANTDEIGAAVDFLWSAYTDPTAYAGLELLIAARTDDDLLANLRPIANRLDESLQLGDREQRATSAARRRRRALRSLVIAALQGLAVMRIVRDDDDSDGALKLLGELCREVLSPAGR